MKDSKQYSSKIQKLYRSLKRKSSKVDKLYFEEPADAVVYAVLAEHLTEKDTQSAMKRFDDYFVDLNDLRVARAEEVIDLIGKDTPESRAAAAALSTLLGGIFNKYHRMSMDALKKIGKRPAKASLEKMEGVSPFVVDFCMVTSLQGHAIPLTKTMLEYLKENELVYPEATEREVEGFLAKQVSAKNGYEFYVLLREESESKSKKKTRRQTKSTGRKSTTKKKTTTKKRTKTTQKKTARRKTSRKVAKRKSTGTTTKKTKKKKKKKKKK